MAHQFPRASTALSLVELLIILAVLGIALAIGALNLMALGGNVANGKKVVASHLLLVRSKAMATGSSYRVTGSAQQLGAAQGMACSGPWKADPDLDYHLPPRLSFAAPWEVCFDARGRAATSETITVTDSEHSLDLVVMLGGGVE